MNRSCDITANKSTCEQNWHKDLKKVHQGGNIHLDSKIFGEHEMPG